MIRIKSDVLNQIIEHAKYDAPVEACGYLGGNDDLVVKVFPMTNADNSPEHFSFKPEEQFKVMKQARNEGLKLIAVYHSHPATPARPSDEDIRLAYDSEISYVIVSLSETEPVVKSFRIKKNEDKEVNEEGIEIVYDKI